MAATKKDIKIKIGKQCVSDIRKYTPNKDENLSFETAPTHGVVDGIFMTIKERGEYSYKLSNGIVYDKKDKSVVWIRMYEIDYKGIDFPTW